MYARAATAYKRADLDSAPKSEIVVRLFVRFGEDVDAARAAIAAKDIVRRATAIDHAMRIVTELRAALDHTAAPALAANLESLYGFVQDQLLLANTKMKPEALDAAARVMRELGEAFATVRNQP